jgi:hypothetical protein
MFANTVIFLTFMINIHGVYGFALIFFYFYLLDAMIYASHSWSTVMYYVNLFCCVIVCFILTIQKRTILGLQELYHELQILDRMEHECQRREGSAAANQRGYFSILFSVISYVVN